MNEADINSSIADKEETLSQSFPSYPGDYVDEDSSPLRDDGLQKLDFPNPAVLLAFYNQDISNGTMPLHKWQVEQLEEFGNVKPTAQHPYKLCLVTCNGSGKDSIIIAGFAIWFALSKIKSRCIITSSSGVQLTSQTETYIKDLAALVNAFHGQEIFRIRQRYIKCRLSGSEIRMFATDEKGKAEGYHPWGTGEMAIIVNEGKTVTDEIHGALKRCSGFNYWLEISSAGEPVGFFYKAYTTWKHTRRVTSYDCPHLSLDEIEEDKQDLGEHSALFRSKHLALFTSIGGEVVIPQDVILSLIENPPDFEYENWVDRVGIDLAAGGDENCVTITNGNRVKSETAFREVDTEITADRIEQILKDAKIPKNHEYIFADDGGVGRSIIDKLVRRGWNIKRVLNQQAAVKKALYGNRGAENWYRVKRILEEKLFDITGLSELTREQLFTRHYRKSNSSARLFLESKKEAKAEGRPSPDRADAFILSLTGVTVDKFIEGKVKKPSDPRPKEKFTSMNDVYEHYETNVTFRSFNKQPQGKSRNIFGSLKAALTRN